MARIVIDTCCLINLVAADALDTWLGDLGHEWIIPEIVSREALTLRGRGPEGEPTAEPISLLSHIETGLLSLTGIEDEQELAAYVEYAQRLDDGEAMALAIARYKECVIATDDRKAQTMAEAHGVEVLTTSQIVKEWAELASVDNTTLAETLESIRKRGRFIPGARDPLRDWWLSHLPE